MGDISLFGLVGEYKELYSLLTDADESDLQVVQDTLEGVCGEIEVKGEGYIALINQLEMEEDACDRQIKEWRYRKQLRTNAIKRLKDRLGKALIDLGMKEIKAGNHKIKLRMNGGLLPLKFTSSTASDIPLDKVDINTIPKAYRKTVVTETVNTEKIREDLNKGIKLDFVRYGNRGQNVKID